MSFLSNTALALSMSADAFAAAISKGIELKKPRWTDALRVGLIFGAVETLTPVIGWLIGSAASGFVEKYDHWVAFVIIAAIGSKMIYEAWRGDHKPKAEAHTLGVLVITAIGTSMDAMAVGVSLALVNANIWVTAAMIGMATFIMATIGVMTGHYIGSKAGRAAEVIGGLCLIAIGAMIVYDHISAV